MIGIVGSKINGIEVFSTDQIVQYLLHGVRFFLESVFLEFQVVLQIV